MIATDAGSLRQRIRRPALLKSANGSFHTGHQCWRRGTRVSYVDELSFSSTLIISSMLTTNPELIRQRHVECRYSSQLPCQALEGYLRLFDQNVFVFFFLKVAT